MKTIEETYRERLILLVKEFGSQQALAEIIDKSTSQISQWLTGAPDSKTGKPRSMKSDTAREIEAKVGKPRGWFDQPINPATEIEIEPKIREDQIRFELLNVKASLGPGIENSEYIEVVDYITVAKKWANRNLGSNLNKIRVITAKGDSMKGTIDNGDVIFVDTSVNFFDGDGIYVIAYKDGLKAKRLTLLSTGTLRIISDNTAYPVEDINEEDIENITICGRVRGAWHLSQFN
ncbi:S24 family peptidase [Kingella negevensis]|uniref:S24 family peptidase n=1 Tax=Kingella negevensis TaxID=1522312 RepID=UPI001FD7FF78|nr:S24 family peptidase [Kingella negevensis]